MVPVVVGSLGMVTKNLAKYLGKIGIPTKIEFLQKAVLLGSARLLRSALEASPQCTNNKPAIIYAEKKK